MEKKLEDVEFTIFDTETTGLNPEFGDRVVEIAAIKYKNKEKIAQFQTLVNPQRPISEAAFQVNRITANMLTDAPRMEQVLPEFLDFIAGTCLCSYNAGFDIGFLHNEILLARSGVSRQYNGFPEPLSGLVIIDILKMAKKLLPHLDRYALWFVAQSLGLEEKQEHRALSDVELTAGVFDRLSVEMEKKGISGFDNVIRLFGLNTNYLNDINTQRIAEIQEAINLGVKMKIKYLSAREAQVSEREIMPKEIKRERGHAYLIGYCCLRGEERTFRIENIVYLEIV